MYTIERLQELLKRASEETLSELVQYAELLLELQGTLIRAPRPEEWAKLPEEVREEIYQQVMSQTAKE